MPFSSTKTLAGCTCVWVNTHNRTWSMCVCGMKARRQTWLYGGGGDHKTDRRKVGQMTGHAAQQY